jgi:formylglycine-generating enzyme required for sulfatase activity
MKRLLFFSITAVISSFFIVTVCYSQSIKGVVFVSVPGGTFKMGDETGELWDGCIPVHTVTVSPFRMSEAEITNAQYCEYLTAALAKGDITAESSTVKGAKGAFKGKEYLFLSGRHDADNRCGITFSNGLFGLVSGHENWPVIYVTWYGAKAFADFYGCDLAREAEWEYACRGGKQYLFGTDDGTVTGKKANYDYGMDNIGHPVNVKSYPKNLFGIYDLSGNVWEWCTDLYETYSAASVKDPKGSSKGEDRVYRGGSFYYGDYYSRSAFRDFFPPATRGYGIGFRVVKR